MKRNFSIAIVGGGITGLTLAALLATGRQSESMRVAVIDAGKRPGYRPGDEVSLRVSAIVNGSAAILDSVGAWSVIREHRVSPYEHMRVWDESDAPDSDTALRFDAAEFATTQLGFITENRLIQHALLQVLDESDVELRYETRIDALPEADLVVGADGARSFVRELVGIATEEWPYQQTALVTHLETGLPHQATAWQRFLRSGPLGMLPLDDGRISVVWSTAPKLAEQALQADDETLGQMLTEASDGVLGDLTVAGPRGAFPLSARHALNYTLPGVALVGDAAHAIHPLAGQGANLGLQDVAELARVLEAAVDAGEYPGDRPVLRRYERKRKGANLTMLHLMTGLNRLFASESAVLGEIRAAGMKLFNHSGLVREHAVKVALGVK